LFHCLVPCSWLHSIVSLFGPVQLTAFHCFNVWSSAVDCIPLFHCLVQCSWLHSIVSLFGPVQLTAFHCFIVWSSAVDCIPLFQCLVPCSWLHSIVSLFCPVQLTAFHCFIVWSSAVDCIPLFQFLVQCSWLHSIVSMFGPLQLTAFHCFIVLSNAIFYQLFYCFSGDVAYIGYLNTSFSTTDFNEHSSFSRSGRPNILSEHLTLSDYDLFMYASSLLSLLLFGPMQLSAFHCFIVWSHAIFYQLFYHFFPSPIQYTAFPSFIVWLCAVVCIPKSHCFARCSCLHSQVSLFCQVQLSAFHCFIVWRCAVVCIPLLDWTCVVLCNHELYQQEHVDLFHTSRCTAL